MHPKVGNGYCNDETNNADCDYDGGDCCGSCVFKIHCSKCECLDADAINGASNTLIGDGTCNDETNKEVCNYDGGDCCKPNLDTEHCTECICHYQETCAAGFLIELVGDGYCHDETNNADCNYDGGDCCSTCLTTDHCSDCECLDGVAGM